MSDDEVFVKLEKFDALLLRGLIPYVRTVYQEHTNEAVVKMLDRVLLALENVTEKSGSSSEEHLWWAVLLDAEIFSEKCDGRDADIQDLSRNILACISVANLARKVLATQFGVNFDELGPRAREKYEQLYHEQTAKRKTEKAYWVRQQRLADAVKKRDRAAIDAVLKEIEAHEDTDRR